MDTLVARPRPQSAAPPAASAPAASQPAVTPAVEPAASSGLGTTWYIAIVVVIALALMLFMRTRKPA
jgi:hypothetical protein